MAKSAVLLRLGRSAGSLTWALLAPIGNCRAQSIDVTGPVPRVVVEAQRDASAYREASVNELSSASWSETPVSASVIDADRLQQLGANSLSSAIRGEPSVGDDYNTFGYVENVQVRGFKLNEYLNFRRDGLPASNHVPFALENKQSIEIVQGLAGVLGGDAAPGGVLNFVLKRPTDTTLRVLDAEYSERGSRKAQGDFGGRWDGQRYGYRVNLAVEDRHPAADNAWSRRVFGSAFLDWRVQPGTVVEFEFEHQGVQQISVPGYSLLYVPHQSPISASGAGVASVVPAPIDPRINLNAQPWSQPFQSRETSGSLRLSQRFAVGRQVWEWGARLSEQRSVTNDRIAFPDGCNGFGSFASQPVVYPGMCQFNGHTLFDLYQYISDDERRDMRVLDSYLHGHLALGGVDQELRLDLRSTRYAERYPPFQTYNFTGVLDVFAPAALPPSPQALTANADLDLHLDEASIFDVLRLGARWSAWLGLRASRLSQESHLDAADSAGSSEPTALRQNFATPFASLAFAPWNSGLAYLSGGEGVEIEQVPNRPLQFINPGQVLPALRSRQVELGFKQNDDARGFSAALFQIDKPFSDDLPPNTAGQVLRVGGARHARHRGVELAGAWHAGAAWAFEAKGTWLDAVSTESLNAAWAGHATPDVPHLAAALRIDWLPPWVHGLGLSNRLTYAGHKAVLPDGSVDISSAWQWDLALRYVLTARAATWVCQAGIDNLTDRRYWRDAPTAPWGAQYLFPAAPRTARAGLQVRF